MAAQTVSVNRNLDDAAPEPVAPIVNVNVPAPIVQNDVRVEVPSRTVIAKPQADGTVRMEPQ